MSNGYTHSQNALRTLSHEPEPDSNRCAAHGLHLSGRALMGNEIVPVLLMGDMIFVKFEWPSGTLLGRVQMCPSQDDWDIFVAVHFNLALHKQWNNRVNKPLMSYTDFFEKYTQEILPSPTVFVRAGGGIVHNWEHDADCTRCIAHDVPRPAITKFTMQHYIA